MDHTLLSQHRAVSILRFVCSACLVPFLAFGNPVGETVRFGDVDFSRSGNRLDVTQRSNQAIIDWAAFSIANGEITDFSQPGVGASALNRVTGVSASQIDGLLRSNGRILLLNPNGIIIGPSGRIDTASFVASTLDISDSDFLAGGDLPLRGTSEAAVINLGTISAFDGDVFLVAASVENRGSIFAPNGTAGLAAGNDVLIRESGEERVWVRGASGEKKESGVVNSGTVAANIAELKSYGGNIYGMAVKNEGRIAATGVTKSGGQIFLSAGGGKSWIHNTGTLIAKRPAAKSGGSISIRNSGEGSHTEMGGTVDVRGTETGGVGGDVLILGSQIDILPDTVILADGGNGGGRIQIGGGRRGENPDFNNAEFVNVAEGVEINASATVDGDGGEVILFATDMLDFYGHASVRGGDVSGDGGFVELSGRRKVNFDGFVKAADTRAVNGQNGSLLFDPINVSIKSTTGIEILGSPVNDQTYLSASDISNYLETVGDLEIRTDGGNHGAGNITLGTSHKSAAINWTAANNLRLIADGSITLSDLSQINSEDGGIYLENLAGTGDGILIESDAQVTSGSGHITMIGRGSAATTGDHDGIRVNPNAMISTSFGGNISLTGTSGVGDAGAGRYGIVLDRSSVFSTGGNVVLNGSSAGNASSSRNGGIRIDRATVGAESGNVTLLGSGSDGAVFNRGVLIEGSTAEVKTTVSGHISITGFGGNGTGGQDHGVAIVNGARVTTANGAINVNGTGGNGGSLENIGVHIDLAGTEVSTIVGDITLRGIAGSGTNANRGVQVDNGAAISIGTGNLVIEGTGGAGSSSNVGVYVVDGADISVTTGNISITGVGGMGSADSNEGVRITSSGTVIATNTGNIVIDGTGGTGTSQNDGVEVTDSAMVRAVASGDITIKGATTALGVGLALTNNGAITVGNGNIELEGASNTAAGIIMNGASVQAASGESTKGHVVATAESDTPIAFSLGDISSNDLMIRSRGGDVSFDTFGTITANHLTLSSAGAPAGFDFSGGDVNVGQLSADSQLGSVDLANNANLTVNDLDATGDIFLEANGTLVTNGQIQSGDDLSLAAVTITINGFTQAVTSITTGPSFLFSTPPPHTLNANSQLDAPQVMINGGFDNDIFNVQGTLGNRDSGNTVTVFGDSGIDTLNANAIDLESTSIMGVETINGVGPLSRILGKDTSVTYTISGNNVVNAEGANFVGFENLQSGMGNDVFQLVAGLVAAPYVEDFDGGQDRVITAAGVNDLVEMDEQNEGVINSVFSFVGIEEVDTNSGDDLFQLNRGARSDLLIGGAGFDRIHTDGLFIIGQGELSSIEEIKGIGNSDLLLLEEMGTSSGETFTLASDGSIGHDEVRYLDFEQLLGTENGDDVFIVQSGFNRNVEILGLGGSDTLVADNANTNVFSIHSISEGFLNQALLLEELELSISNSEGNLNSLVRFNSVENLVGGAGRDDFNFSDQVTVASVDGRGGNDRLTIDDTNLEGTNRYSVSEGVVSRSPQYFFSGVETVALFLGSGNDTVDVLDTSFALSLDGGAGFDTLNMPGGDLLDGNPIRIGVNFVNYANFEAPTGSQVSVGPESVPNPGNLQANELEKAAFIGQWGGAGSVDGQDNYVVENLFNQGGEGEEVIRFGIRDLAGGAFGASAAVMNLAQQLVTLTIDSQQFLLNPPASLDGTFDQPPFEIIEQLRENLGTEANGELARALDYTDGAFMVSSDEAYAIDLSGPPPAALLQLLQDNLGIRAAQELSDALGLIIALPLSNLDGPTVIGLIVIPPGAGTVAALLEQLGAPAENELKAALGN